MSVTETVDSDENLKKPDYLETVIDCDPTHGSMSSVLLFVSFDPKPNVAKVKHRDTSSLDSDEHCITVADLG